MGAAQALEEPQVDELRVAIAHEWLVRYAGSERCVEQLLELFPDARLLTTLLSAADLPTPFARAEPSFLQRIPGAVRRHQWLIPLMPAAWRLRAPVRGVDVVVSSSHACATAVRIERGIPHVCYCHTPMRYAWLFGEERRRFPLPLRPAALAWTAAFRHWDRALAQRVTRFVANSTEVARRIATFYGRTAQVVHPPVRTDFFTPGGERGDEFLFVGRLVAYKRAELVVEAFAELPHALTVVGRGPLAERLRRRATANVRFVEAVDDHELRRLYRSARALVTPAVEDFGIVTAEAQSCGTPVIALAAGGALDIVEDGVTGWLLDRADVRSVRTAVQRAVHEPLEAEAVSERAQRFAAARFRRQMAEIVADVVDDAAAGDR